MVKAGKLVKGATLTLALGSLFYLGLNQYCAYIKSNLKDEIRKEIRADLDEDWRVLSAARQIAMAQDDDPSQFSPLECNLFSLNTLWSCHRDKAILH